MDLSCEDDVWLDKVNSLGPAFGSRASHLDEAGAFASANYADLKESGLLSAGVPKELGGGGAEYRILASVIRRIAHFCGSTALAFSMHTHLVVGAAWRWRNWNQPLDGLLRRVAEERLVLLTSGGIDWLDSSGKAIPVEGGFLVSARKAFVSGAPAGDLLITSAICDDPQDGAMVLHLSVPMNSKGCTIEPTWNAMGMRATGSHDVVLSDVFVPERSVSAKRQKGTWHRMVHLSAMVPLPLIYSVYAGIAEAMRELTLQHVGNRRSDPDTCTLIGFMENHLFAANLAVQDMVQTASSSEPGPTTTNRIMMGRSVVESSIRSLADVVMDIQGGAAYSRHNAFERMFRDLQGARYHTMKGSAQRQYAASLALGQSMD